MSVEADSIVGAATLGVMLGCLVAWALTFWIEETLWHRQGIEHNAAEWVLDPKTGATEWRWKEKP